MTIVRQFFRRKIEMRPVICILIIFIYSVLLAGLMLLIQPNGVFDLLDIFNVTRLVMPLLNFLPVLFLMLLLYFISSRFVLSAGTATLLFIAMSVVNRYKIYYRDHPFFSWDISSAGELVNIIRSYSSTVIIVSIILVLIIALIVLLSIKIKSQKLPWPARLIGALACISLIWAGNAKLYSSETIYHWLYEKGDIYKQTDLSNSKGFLYYFIYNYNINSFQLPDDYDKSEIEDVLAAYTSADLSQFEGETLPHIIMVMGESFSALSENVYFDFSGYTDPLENFKALATEGISGTIIVPTKGGGTVNTEFDVLTGLATRYLLGAADSYSLVNRDVEALPAVLSRLGYASAALHPGDNWFYNRQNVFDYFGFDQTYFRDAFEQDYMGYFITDRASVDGIISVFEGHLETDPDTPLFEFCVTIQNHGPYENKYFTSGTNFSTSLPLSESDSNMLANYFQGVTDGDVELARLAEYLEMLDEPAVLVYFGDHYPLRGTSLYDMLFDIDAEEGSYEYLSNIVDIPYLIWQNSAARKTTQIAENAQTVSLPEDMGISSNYLGAYLLELLGYNGISAYFDYTNEMRAIFPVIFETRSFMPDGTYSDYADAESVSMLGLYKNWMYYQILGK